MFLSAHLSIDLLGIVRRQSIKIVTVYAIGVLVGYFNLLWLLPYCLPSTEEIGLVRIIVSAATLLGVFIPIGVQKIVLRYFPYYQDREKGHNGLIPFAILLTLAGFILVGSILYLFHGVFIDLYEERSPLFVNYFYYVLPIGAAIAYHKVFLSYGRSLMKPVIPNFLQSVGIRIFTSTAVILYFFGILDLTGLVQGYLTAYLLVALLLLAYCQTVDPSRGVFRAIRIPFDKMKEMTRFGFYMMLTSAGGILIRTIDELMLGSLLGLSQTGIYSIAFFIGVVVEQPKRAVLQPLTPLVAKARKEGDERKIERLFKKSSINNILVGGLLFIGIWANLDDLFRIMPQGETFRQGSYVVLFIGFSKLFTIGVGMTNEVLMTSPWYRFNFYSMVGTIPVAVLLNLLLIPILGIEGAAIASLISNVLLNGVRTAFIYFKESIQPFTYRTILAILLLAGSYFLSELIPMPNNALTAIFTRSFCIALVFGVGAYFLRLSEDGNELIKQQLSKLFKH